MTDQGLNSAADYDEAKTKQAAFHVSVQHSRIIVYNFSFAIGLLAWLLDGIELKFWPLLAVLIAANLSALSIIWTYKRTGGLERRLDLAPAWMGVDVLFITAAVALTGGFNSPWYVWYIANTAAAAFVKGARAAVLVMTANAAAYLGLMAYYTHQGQSGIWVEAVVRLLLIYGASFFALLAIGANRKKRLQIQEMRERERERMAELVRVGRQLEAKTAQLDTVATTAPVGLALIKEGRIEWANEEMARLVGKEGEELSGRLWEEVAPGLEWVESSEASVCHLGGEGPEFDCLIRMSWVDRAAPEAGMLVSMTDITRRHRAEAALRVSEERYRAIFEGAAEGYMLIGENVLDCNPKAADILGLSPDEVITRSIVDLAPPYQPDGRPSAEVVQEMIERARSGESPFFYWQVRRSDGTLIDTEVWLKGLSLDEKEQPVLLGMRDVTESLRLSAELARSQAEYRKLYQTARRDEQLIKSLLAVSGDPIMILDAEGRCRFINDAFSATFGWTAEEMVEGTVDFIPAGEAESEAWIWKELKDSRPVVGLETTRLTKNGREVPVSISAASVFDEQSGRAADALFILRDVTAQREAAEALRKAYELQKELADRDALTGLLNHRRIQEEIDKEILRSRRAGGMFSVILLDLDDFKYLNDTYGHPFGDEALKLVSTVLKKNCRSSDVVGRYGGDEFIAILPGAGATGARQLAERIAADLSERTLTTPDGEAVGIRASIGLATFPFDSASKAELIRLADQAMYRAKAAPGDYTVSSGRIGLVSRGWREGFDGVLRLLDALDARDHYTRAYTDKVVETAESLGRTLGLSDEEMGLLRQAALVHDLGNIYVPEEIRLKPGLLTEEEQEIVRQHPNYIYHLLKAVSGIDQRVLDAVLYHHEHWDGKGHPHGIEGEEIPLLARILGLSAVVGALTIQRSRRPAGRGDDYINKELRLLAGSELDPRLVDAYLAAQESS